MTEAKSTQTNAPSPIIHDENWPRMVTLIRADKEIAAIGAADAEDAARQVAILVLKQDGGLRIGDVIQISRI